MTPLKYVVNLVDMWSHNSVCVMWLKLDLLRLITNSYIEHRWWYVCSYTQICPKKKCTLFGALHVHVHLFLVLWYVHLHSLESSVPRLQTADHGLLASYPCSFSLNARERSWHEGSRLQTTDCELHILQSILAWDQHSHFVCVHLILKFYIFLWIW